MASAVDNTALRSTIATLAKGIFNFQFTEALQIGGRVLANGVCQSEIDESDKLEIAGTDYLRAVNVMALAADLVGCEYTVGDSVVLNKDPAWQIRKFKPSPDGATITFTLIDAD